jgi:hypothetical protein
VRGANTRPTLPGLGRRWFTRRTLFAAGIVLAISLGPWSSRVSTIPGAGNCLRVENLTLGFPSPTLCRIRYGTNPGQACAPEFLNEALGVLDHGAHLCGLDQSLETWATRVAVDRFRAGETSSLAFDLYALLWNVGLLGGAAVLVRSVRRFVVARRMLGRIARGCCYACGYDLRGSPEQRCPECGTECRDMLAAYGPREPDART